MCVVVIALRSFERIRDTCANMYRNFKDDPSDVQKEWGVFVRRFDQLLEDNLRLAVKKSLQELSRAITGDSKGDVPPLFRVRDVTCAATLCCMERPGVVCACPVTVEPIVPHALCRAVCDSFGCSDQRCA